ncbi:M56 family metallopeptidase [Clostridium ljungdahlii]|uniref:Regulatory protein BlaR1 n=1 Tax=Clostridium ljungdahlii TaxID=1538 RepID=A0A166R7E6_9CLOT|nr:M56 family metallopeptidase [Clostridium ljungdahlii]OAA90623.1 Regulatory protein BlaR1 [Clostridium ljungdahlii]
MQLSYIFKMVVLSSVVGSIVTIIILVLKNLLKNKLNASWQYFIWFLLIIRLIIPTGFDTPLSKFNVFANATQKIQTSQNIVTNTNYEENNIKSDSQISKSDLEKRNDFKETKVKDFNYYFNAASVVWALGVILILSIILSMNGIFFLKVRKQSYCEDIDTITILKKSKSIMNISRSIPIIYDKYVKTPSLFGVVNPKILIDSDLVQKLSFEEKKCIFLHELSHFKRKDIFVNWITLLLEIINWFNPVIWFAFSKMREDSELACDAHVLSYLGEEEQNKYGETIIKLARFVSGIKSVPGTSGIIKKGSNIKRRVIMIKNFKKHPFKWIGVPVSILAAVCMIGITNIPAQAMELKTNDEVLKPKESKINYPNIAKEVSTGSSQTTTSNNKKETKSGSLETDQSKTNYVNVVKSFLPKNAQIVTWGNTKEEDNVFLRDLDGDGTNEIITSYKLNEKNEKINVMALKKVGENWTKILDEPGEGFKIDFVQTADIDGDGENEVLLGRRIGGTTGQLSVYKWNNNALGKISNEDIYYSKLDIVDVPGENMKAIAVWNHDTGDAYMVDVLKWNGKTFKSAEDLYPNYFKQSVVPYYEQKVKEMPKIGFYWYYLGDSQIKAGDKESAIKSIEEGLKLNTGYPSQEEFNKLKEKASK